MFARIRPFTQRYTDFAYLLLRLLVSFALLRAHGLPKLLHFEETMAHIPDPFGFGSTFSTYFAVIANVFGGTLVALGLLTRIAALSIVSITLSGLLFVHLHDSVKIQDTPLIYTILFAFIAFTGGGKFSLDSIVFKS